MISEEAPSCSKDFKAASSGNHQPNGCHMIHGSDAVYLRHPKFAWKRLKRSPHTYKLFLSGGAPLPSSLVERDARQGIMLCKCYGSTESCPHAYVPSLQKCARMERFPFSGVALEGHRKCGRRRMIARFRTAYKEKKPAAGLISSSATLNNPEETEKALDDDGWFTAETCASWTTRVAFASTAATVIRGGENISTCEVDNAVDGWK